MEFRCRLASPNGKVIEGIYVADSEARLRHELEERGLHVLSLQPKGASGRPVGRLPQRGTVPAREFLVFNQELATLLKAGMPLVQSLDLLKRRIESPVFEACSTTCTSGCARARRCRTRSRAHDALLPSVYTASLLAGERSGNLDSVLRRFVDYSKTIAT